MTTPRGTITAITATLLALLLCFSAARGQTLRGTVYDRASDSTIGFAIIYINGTTTGTYSDIHGDFELDISKYSSMPVTISMIGYYSFTLNEHNSNKQYDIYLVPKLKVLNEVVVSANGKRKTYLRIFRREFLGETGNAMECDILNENDIRFVFLADSNMLNAYTSAPILVRNNALGYTITYYLDKFMYKRDISFGGELTETTTIIGNYLFKDDIETLNEHEKMKIEAIRKNAYLGSRMHFFRLLCQGDLIQSGNQRIIVQDISNKSEGFIVGSESGIRCDSIIYKPDSLAGYLQSKEKLKVSYKWKNSALIIKRDPIYFEKDGFYDPYAVEFSGEMSKQRIGDLLPYEYQLK